MNDAVDTYMEQWMQVRPDLDIESMSVIGRLSRVGRLLAMSIRDNLHSAEMEPWEFDVLATLRRSGGTYTLTPKQLVAMTMVGSAAMTHRIDRLVERGLVTRRTDPNSRRQLLISLTEEGQQLIDGVIGGHTDNASEFLGGLSDKDSKTLNRILRDLLLSHNDVMEIPA